MGVSLTRTITGAVHNLYEGTERVKGGDFSHRISVEGNDQLAELGRSFNGMTENLERLIVVEKEQERLKSEIEIAREVQSQLFPRSSPVMKTIELTGVCHPARMVSGDYYDFVRLGDSNLALAIGDVAGKGISAALLMAAIQSIMRTQLTAGVSLHAVAASGGGNGKADTVFSAAELVSQLNKQVYANTSAEKYATFFFGLYDDDSRMLTYTNAGHLPPIVMRGGQAERMEVTGTVVGAFPFAAYQEESVELRQGDLLVAFTDGIVEPENEYGEAFGEDRLIDLLARYGQRESKEIIARVMETVEQWTGTVGTVRRHDDSCGARRLIQMKVLTAAQMREVDRRTIQMGIPATALMENAGTRVTEFLDEKFSPLGEHRVFVYCGKGNNGGDGMVVARQLFTRYHPKSLHVVLVGSADQLKGEAAENYRLLVAAGCPVLSEEPRDPGPVTIVVDALLGTGVHGPATGAVLEAIRRINTGFPGAKIVAVDIPSGLASDTGNRLGESVRADYTVTFTAPKVGQMLPPNCELRGRADAYVPSAAHLTCTKATTPSFFHSSSLPSSTVCSNRGHARRTKAVSDMCWFWLALAEKRGRRPWLEWRHCALALAW